MAGRNKRCSISLEQKLKVLAEVDKKSMTKTKIAKSFNIPKSTLFSIIKNRDSIMRAKQLGVPRSRRRSRDGKFRHLEKVLYEWLKLMKSIDVPVDGSMLKTQAQSFAEEMDIDEKTFKASNGWLQKFKVRHGVFFLKVNYGNDIHDQPVTPPSSSEQAVSTYITPNQTDKALTVKEETPDDKEIEILDDEPSTAESHQSDDLPMILPCSVAPIVMKLTSASPNNVTESEQTEIGARFKEAAPQQANIPSRDSRSEEFGSTSSVENVADTSAIATKQKSFENFTPSKRMKTKEENDATPQPAQHRNEISHVDSFFKYLGSIIKTWPSEVQQRELLNIHKLVIERHSQIQMDNNL